MAKNISANNETIQNVPEWLNEELFEEFLLKDFPNFNKITKFIVKPAVANGENYMTVMLRVLIEVELNDSNNSSTSYMIKIKPATQKLQLMIKEWKIFEKEHTTYIKYITAFEEYYKKAGCNIKLSPHILEPTWSNINDDVLILEDLRLKGFENFNRHLGLDLLHTKAVLQKLAQFHAASAHYFIEHGIYPEMYDKCLTCQNDLFIGHRKKINEVFTDYLDVYGNLKHLEEKLVSKLKNFKF